MTEKNASPTNSTMAGRRTEREAREAAGESQPPRRTLGFRAGYDADNPLMVITHVQA